MKDSYVNFLAAELFAEVSGMNAENDQRKVLDESMAYSEEDYLLATSKYREHLHKYQKQIRKNLK